MTNVPRFVYGLLGELAQPEPQALFSRVYLDMGEYQSAYVLEQDPDDVRHGITQLSLTANNSALPIPQSEIDANPNMVQNVR